MTANKMKLREPDRHRLLIVQPYVPAYRLPFFHEVRRLLAEHGVQIAIAASRASGRDAARNDDQTGLGADFVLHQKTLSIGSRSVLFKRLDGVLSSFAPGLVVVEQAVKNLESWPLLLRSRGDHTPSVAIWGQGRSYSTQQNAVVAKLKQHMTKRADWFFSYTPRGAEYVVERGFPQAQTTVVWNSTDTAALQADVEAVTPTELKAFQDAHGLKPGHTGFFIGGVDKRKGISFLLESCRELRAVSPDFRLLIAGSGDMDGLVAREVAGSSAVKFLGRLEGKDKAVAFAASDFLMVPEWIGLVAVDCLATGKPMVSTRHDSHSPEFEYLVEGETLLLSRHTPTDFAQAVFELINNPERLTWMSQCARRDSVQFSVENMANNFVDGVIEWRSHLAVHDA